MGQADDSARFAELALPHLDAAYNLARWLTRDSADAADVVQEAMMRALRFLRRLPRRQRQGVAADDRAQYRIQLVGGQPPGRDRRISPVDDATDAYERAVEGVASPLESPEALLIRAGENRQLNDLIAALPAEFRECLVLRELEELSYKEIAAVIGVPIGTVMSRLARARRLIQRGWAAEGG